MNLQLPNPAARTANGVIARHKSSGHKDFQLHWLRAALFFDLLRGFAPAALRCFTAVDEGICREYSGALGGNPHAG